jgi:TonB family protein
MTHAAAASPPSGANAPLDLPLEGEVTSPNWRSLPSGDDMSKEYPMLAQMMNLAGEATIRCTVDTDGRLQDCKVVSESPSGMGFGAAAERLSAYFSMKPAQIDGQAVKDFVTIPIKFALDGATNAVAETEPPPPTSPTALELARKLIAEQGVASRFRDKWEPVVKQLVSEAALNGDIKSSVSALDAFQQGLDDVIQRIVERQARMTAAKMTDEQLRVSLAYFDSPAGKAWLSTGLDLSVPSDLNKRVAAAAHDHLCRSVACDANGRPKMGQAASQN